MPLRDVLATNAGTYRSWLTEACSIPSMASEPDALTAMAGWLEDRLAALGASVERLTHEGAPDMLLARLGSGERTVLVYDHYDVQPVDPLELWTSEPFTPEVRDGLFYARGAADNKGDLVARLAGLHAYLQANEELPVMVKLLIEGEEETGSRSFGAMVDEHGDKLAADGCIWEGNGIDPAGRPSFVFGAKGLAYVELSCKELGADQHSALAVVAPSAPWRLIEALSSLRAPDGSVLIDGFYDDVVAPSGEDMAMLERLPFDEAVELHRLGAREFVGGARGLELLRRYYFEPTCNIAGIVAGFTVPGQSKTVLPAGATAKIDMRLVPGQDPDAVVEKLRRHLDARGFEDIAIARHSMEAPVRSPADSLIARAALTGATGVYFDPPAVAPMMIGTGPMHHIAHTLGIPTVSPAGVFRPESAIHAPNENCRLEDFERTTAYTASWIDALATLD